MTIDNSEAPTGPLGRFPWLVFAALAAHVLEEWQRFPEWATRHFGTTTSGFFAVSHIPILVTVAWVAWRCARPAASTGLLVCLLLILAALGTNVVFHATTTVLYGEYSPGLVSAVLLYVPLTAVLLPRISALVGRRRAVVASIAGIVVSVLITATLVMDMPRL